MKVFMPEVVLALALFLAKTPDQIKEQPVRHETVLSIVGIIQANMEIYSNLDR